MTQEQENQLPITEKSSVSLPTEVKEKQENVFSEEDPEYGSMGCRVFEGLIQN